MKKTKYIASIWVPGPRHPAASFESDRPMPIDFERVVDHGTPAPFYETDNYAGIVINLENGECRTYANMPYRLIVRPVILLTPEQFKEGVKFKISFAPESQIYSYDLIDGESRLIVHKRDRALTPSNAFIITNIKGSHIELEDGTKMKFTEMYKHD